MGKNMLKLDTRGFTEYVRKFEKINADIKPIFAKALNEGAEQITKDTIDGMKDSYLPAGGIYSTGRTKSSIVQNPKAEWVGLIGEVAVGFDFGKPGAGGLLITGTPKMRPDERLNEIYKTKRYMKSIEKKMVKIFDDELKSRLG